MKFKLTAASLVALALFAGPSMAKDQPLMQLAQAAVPAEVEALLADKTPLSELTVPQLTQRIRQGRTFIQAGNLPKDVVRQVRGVMAAAVKERASRQQAEATQPAQKQPAQDQAAQEQPAQEQPAQDQAAQAQPAQEQPAQDQAAQEQPAQEQMAQSDAPAAETTASGKIPAAVTDYLNDTRSAEEMSMVDLRNRVRSGQRLAQIKALPAETRQQIRQHMRADRLAMQSKAGAAQQTDTSQDTTAQPQDAPAPETTVKTAESRAVPGDVTTFLADNRDPNGMTVQDLRTRIRLAQTLSQTPGLSTETRLQIRARIRADRMAVQAKPPVQADGPPEDAPVANADGPPEDVANGGQIKVDNGDVSRLDRNQGDPEAEGRAQAILADSRRPNQMTVAELRTSLNDIRALLGENKLSQQTERQLRQKLGQERQVLRTRVLAERREENPRRDRPGRRDDQIDPKYLVNVEIVLQDRRNSDELADRELRRRIEVLLRAMEDQRYEAAERARWRQQVERDRRFLRQRMVDFRRERQNELRDEPNIEIGINLDSGQRPVIDAAEADDQEIEDVLVAAPTRKFDKRYTVEDIENSAELRNALPRVEIDTIKFGFNESFVREEEVDNLERVGEIIERVLAAHPREVFLIEGHTDAVGSDAYNLDLSRQRAVAVKQALSEYFVIPAENLRTAGYGERYLKIPTAEAEAENRRVSVSRATALIGEAQQ